MENRMNNPLETAQEIGVKKTEKSIKSLLFLGFLAGLEIAFAALASTVASMNLLKSPETYGLGKLIQGLVFSGGLIMVILSGAELFTGNSLMLISLFDRRISPKRLLKNWGFVYLGNLLGSLFLAFLVAFSGILGANSGLLGETFTNITTSKISLSFLPAFSLGILCNILVCLAVYISFSSKTLSGKLLACIFPVTFFVMCGFEHSIANMFYIPVGFLSMGNWNLLSFLSNLLPVTLGNALGGTLIAAIFYFSSNHATISLWKKQKSKKNPSKSNPKKQRKTAPKN